jgi:hypothetical protein
MVLQVVAPAAVSALLLAPSRAPVLVLPEVLLAAV